MDFEPSIRTKGTLLMNTTLIDRSPQRSDLEIVSLPATELADRMKEQNLGMADTRVFQNSVAYGGLIAVEGQPFDRETVQQILEHVYTGNKAKFIPANLAAVQLGYEYLHNVSHA
jgi:2-oxoglutarate ferredoxin oxidoreductase subunit gamma